jgi:indole-3-glycerol phosphate synthase
MTIVTRKPGRGGASAGATASALAASSAARSRAGVVADIAARRLADVQTMLNGRTFRSLAEDAAAVSAEPGRAPRPVAERLARPGLHLIAEVKRRSPSVGEIASQTDPAAQARAYEAGGAAAISVLCEPHWFGGSVADLMAVRKAVSIPVLAKEFVVDERQLPLLRSAGADMVLLLASILPARKLARFAELARELGMEPLVEVHDRRELDAALTTPARIIGLNNRNLRTLEVDPEHCLRLRPLVPDERLVVGESGVTEARTLVGWRAAGARRRPGGRSPCLRQRRPRAGRSRRRGPPAAGQDLRCHCRRGTDGRASCRCRRHRVEPGAGHAPLLDPGRGELPCFAGPGRDSCRPPAADRHRDGERLACRGRRRHRRHQPRRGPAFRLRAG